MRLVVKGGTALEPVLLETGRVQYPWLAEDRSCCYQAQVWGRVLGCVGLLCVVGAAASSDAGDKEPGVCVQRA